MAPEHVAVMASGEQSEPGGVGGRRRGWGGGEGPQAWFSGGPLCPVLSSGTITALQCRHPAAGGTVHPTGPASRKKEAGLSGGAPGGRSSLATSLHGACHACRRQPVGKALPGTQPPEPQPAGPPSVPCREGGDGTSLRGSPESHGSTDLPEGRDVTCPVAGGSWPRRKRPRSEPAELTAVPACPGLSFPHWAPGGSSDRHSEPSPPSSACPRAGGARTVPTAPSRLPTRSRRGSVSSASPTAGSPGGRSQPPPRAITPCEAAPQPGSRAVWSKRGRREQGPGTVFTQPPPAPSPQGRALVLRRPPAAGRGHSWGP